MNPYEPPVTEAESRKLDRSSRLHRACAATAYGGLIFTFLAFAISVLSAGAEPSRNLEWACMACMTLGVALSITACIWTLGHWLVGGVMQRIGKTRS